ncbi:MAG: hypothetical protein JSW67_07960 [Candidatus Latescibacterota bacterium]|nr:MAG: hypothetical protein JSW67_07960 [Candidatus Latescibacterota bacterium]
MSCEKKRATEPDGNVPECSGPVQLTVSPGTSPTFSWTPDCAIGRLIVMEGAEERFGTETLGENNYRSPIQYGVHPPTAAEPDDPWQPLFEGHTYEVTLYRWITVFPESFEVHARVEFTP